MGLLIAQNSLQGIRGADAVLQVGMQAVLASPDRIIISPLKDWDAERRSWGRIRRPELVVLLGSLQGKVEPSGELLQDCLRPKKELLGAQVVETLC